MKKITDRYHQKIQADNKYLDPLFDLKEVPKRTYQLGVTALVMGLCLATINSAIGLYVSSFTIACFCFCILMFMLLKYHEAINDLTISIFSMICALLIFLACLEGLQSEEYLFFFPVLIAVPLVVDLKQARMRKSATFIGIIILAFIFCIVIGAYVKPMEDFTTKQISRAALINRFTALGSTILLAALYTFFEKRYLDELMAQSRRVIDSKTQFLATMGHELRTPLNGIVGVINLMKNETAPSKKQEYTRIIEDCADHMLHQVNDILDLNKIEAGKVILNLKEVNIKDLLMKTAIPFKALAAAKGVNVETEIDAQLDLFILADNLRLIQIINNLFANALKFTKKGFIKLTAVCEETTEESVSVLFAIEDSGSGIDQDDQEKIFESFWQVYDEENNKLTGTGLGLTICNRLLALMGGQLEVQSEKGTGSKFSFGLIFKLAVKPEFEAVHPLDEEKDLAGINVLLAEDNKLNMMVAKRILNGFKAKVTIAYDGFEALQRLDELSSLNVILLDLEMPVMNGYEAIYEIRKQYPDVPVIAFTASLVDNQMLDDLLASGFTDCILKPFQPIQLLHIINKHINTRVA